MRFLLFVGLLFCAACSYLNPITLAKLSGMSPLTADPGGFEVYVDLPEGVTLEDRGAYLDISAKRSDTGETLSERVYLRKSDTTKGIVWRIPEADLPRLRAAQTKANAWETEAPDESSGSLSVSLDSCLGGREPTPDDVFSVAMRMVPDGPIRPLLSNVPVQKIGEADVKDAVCSAH